MIQLPELCRAGLLDLYVKAETAKKAHTLAAQTYTIASNSALTAIGLDLRDNININLDSGQVTVEPKEPVAPTE